MLVALRRPELVRKLVVIGQYFNFDGEVPASPAVAQVFMWKTESISLTLSDVPGAGGVTLEVGSPGASVPMKFACTSDGIELSIGASKLLLSAASVSVNDGALEVK